MSFLASGVEKISRYLWKRQCFVPWRSFQFPLRASGTRKCEIKWNWKEREREGKRGREREKFCLWSTPSPGYIPRIVSFLPDGETLYEVGYEVRAKLEALLVLFKLWWRYILSRPDLSFTELLALALTLLILVYLFIIRHENVKFGKGM